MTRIVGIVLVAINTGTEASPTWTPIKTKSAYREDMAFEVARIFEADDVNLQKVLSGKHYWIIEILSPGPENTATHGLETKLGPPIAELNGGANGLKVTLKDENGVDVVHLFGNVYPVGKRHTKPEAPGESDVVYTLNAKSRTVS